MRLRGSREFAATVRSGVRARRGYVVVHGVRRPNGTETQVGFIVSKAVGTAVQRHRITRRLRHVMRDLLVELPAGLTLVIRALPGIEEAAYSALYADVQAASRVVAGRVLA